MENTGMPCKESQIPRAFGDLEHRLDVMKDVFKDIKTRIEPVLRPDIPMLGVMMEGKKLNSESPTAMTSQIRSFVNQVEKITEDMRNILNRIEL